MTEINKLRAEFIEWCKRNEYDHMQRLDGSGFNHAATVRAWAAWQEAISTSGHAEARIAELEAEKEGLESIVVAQAATIAELRAAAVAAQVQVVMGLGRYVVNHSDVGEPPQLIISAATDQDRAGREVGESRDNAPGKTIDPKDMAVRIFFDNSKGIDAIETQLRLLREAHFKESITAQPPASAQPAEPVNASGQSIQPLLDTIEILCNGIEWNIENHPDIMTQADDEVLGGARTLLARYENSHIAQPAARPSVQDKEDAARYRWLRDRNDWYAEPRLDEEDGTVWKLTFYTPAPIIDATDDDSLDVALIAAMLADAAAPTTPVVNTAAAPQQREVDQRARIEVRFKNRARTASTADFDLPAPNDPITPSANVPADGPCEHSEHVRPSDGVCVECGDVVAQQDADKETAQPVGWITKEQLANLTDESSDAWIYWKEAGHAGDPDEIPLYARLVAAQPDPAKVDAQPVGSSVAPFDASKGAPKNPTVDEARAALNWLYHHPRSDAYTEYTALRNFIDTRSEQPDPAMTGNELSDAEIDAVVASMPGGMAGFLKEWGYIHFARTLLARKRVQPASGEDL